MSSRKPVIRISAADRDTKEKFSLLSVWRGNFAGAYSLSLDKGSDKYPALGFLDALKRFAAGSLYINIVVESETEQQGGRSEPRRESPKSDDFSDDQIPF